MSTLERPDGGVRDLSARSARISARADPRTGESKARAASRVPTSLPDDARTRETLDQRTEPLRPRDPQDPHWRLRRRHARRIPLERQARKSTSKSRPMKRAVLLLIMSVYLIGTNSMSADIFTKALEKTVFIRHRAVIMNLNGGIRASLEQSMVGTSESVRRMISFEAMRQAWMVDAVRLGGSVEAEPVTCMGVCVCAHGGTWVGTLPLRRGSAALGGARRVERSGLYYLPYQGGDPAQFQRLYLLTPPRAPRGVPGRGRSGHVARRRVVRRPGCRRAVRATRAALREAGAATR